MLAQHGGMKRMDWFRVGRDLFKGEGLLSAGFKGGRTGSAGFRVGRTGFGWFRVGRTGFGWFWLVPLFSNYPRIKSIEKIMKPTATITRRTSSEANLKYISSNLHRTIE